MYEMQQIILIFLDLMDIALPDLWVADSGHRTGTYLKNLVGKSSAGVFKKVEINEYYGFYGIGFSKGKSLLLFSLVSMILMILEVVKDNLVC